MLEHGRRAARSFPLSGVVWLRATRPLRQTLVAKKPLGLRERLPPTKRCVQHLRTIYRPAGLRSTRGHGPNNSFKPTPHRGVNSVLYATLHAVATPLRGGLTQALGRMKLDLTPLLRFMEHLPKNGDLELGLLKTHLLCEEVLTKAIERHLPNPDHLEKAKLSFAQKIQLGHCFYPAAKTAWLWPALQKMNRARNKLAHGLSTEQISEQIDAFIEFVEQNIDAPEPQNLSLKFGRFHWATFSVFSMLAGAAHYDPSQNRSPTLLGSTPDAA